MGVSYPNEQPKWPKNIFDVDLCLKNTVTKPNIVILIGQLIESVKKFLVSQFEYLNLSLWSFFKDWVCAWKNEN